MSEQDDKNKEKALTMADQSATATKLPMPSKQVRLDRMQRFLDQREEREKRHRDLQPLDLERHCGVELSEGGHCKRALTCQGHSDEQKRNVHGRSRSFDELVQAYRGRMREKMMRAAYDPTSTENASTHFEASKSERRNALVVGEKDEVDGAGADQGADKDDSKD